MAALTKMTFCVKKTNIMKGVEKFVAAGHICYSLEWKRVQRRRETVDQISVSCSVKVIWK